MGRIYKALQRNNNLANTRQAFKDYVSFIEEQDRKKKLFDLLNTAKNQIQQGFNPVDVSNPEYKSSLNTQTNDSFMQGNDMRKETGLQMLSKTPQTVKKVDYEKGTSNAKGVISDLLLKGLGGNVDNTGLSSGIEALKLLVPDKPKAPEAFELSEGQQRFEIDPVSKQIRLVAENKKDVKPGEKFKNFSEKGYWDTSDENNPKWIANPNYKESVSSSESLGWRKYYDELDEKNKKLSEEEKINQAKYNAIMGAPFLTMDELVTQGILENKNDKYGGAYLVRDDDGKAKLVYGEKVLENYAKTIVPKAPNKWSREKKKSDDNKTEKKTKTDKNQVVNNAGYVEGKTYIDANGNKAVYKNGKFEEIQ